MNDHWITSPVRRGLDSIVEEWAVITAPERLGYIGGSYAAFMAAQTVTPVIPNDVDIFAVSNRAADEIYNRLVMTNHYAHVRETAVAFTIRRCRDQLQFQVVKPHPDWKTFPDDVMASFDLDVCRAMLLGPEAGLLVDVNVGLRRAKLLLINNPLRSLKRVMKYHARGVELQDRELIKLFRAWEAATPERRAEIIRQVEAEMVSIEPDSDQRNYDEDDYFDGE